MEIKFGYRRKGGWLVLIWYSREQPLVEWFSPPPTIKFYRKLTEEGYYSYF
jgi:hypothetical protein